MRATTLAPNPLALRTIMPVSLACYRESLSTLNTIAAYNALRRSGLLAINEKWATRQASTLLRAYHGLTGKVQVTKWDRGRQYALYLAGWEVYARPVGRKYQLVFAPVGSPEAELINPMNRADLPRDLYATC